MHTTTCPQCECPAKRYAFATTTNYLACPNGHVFSTTTESKED